jgi:GTP-binding protein
VVNKWDKLAGSMPTEKWVRYLRDTFRTMPYAPIAFITGQTGKNVKALLNHGQMLFKQARSRVSTSELNAIVQAAVERNPPPSDKGRNPKIFFATQVGVEPPTIVLFCNHPSALDQTYRRYLLNTLRDHLPFAEVPIQRYLRKRDSHGGGRRDEEGDDDVGADAEAAEA